MGSEERGKACAAVLAQQEGKERKHMFLSNVFLTALKNLEGREERFLFAYGMDQETLDKCLDLYLLCPETGDTARERLLADTYRSGVHCPYELLRKTLPSKDLCEVMLLLNRE
ncbi:MAG: hypothetical protein CMI16_07030 [Opitutaceae bacterium]|nr:hypothetical protein [Opitutaceae bacterium]